MRNIAFINCTGFTQYSFKSVRDGKSSVELAVEYSKTLEYVEKTVIITETENIDKFEHFKTDPDLNLDIVTADNLNTADLFNIFLKESDGYKYIFYYYGDCPFLDAEAADRMYKNHCKYFAQYSFADGNPYGLAPEIISSEIAGALKVLAEKNPEKAERDAVFKTIQRDINTFDIETDISEKDLRLLRVSLTADSKRNFMLLERFAEENAASENDIVRIIEEKGAILRTLPAYYQIQISEKCYQKCSYCPYPDMNPDLLVSENHMSLENVKIILDKIKDFSDDAVISLSLWGEANAHPEFEEMINLVMKYDSFTLIIETSGLGLDKQLLKGLSEKYQSRITWIVSLDTDNEELYGKIRGEGFSKARSSAELLVSLFPENTFLQAVRMKETENDLENFYKKWKALTENVIIQKYDNFCGFLRERKVTDISPLKRFPCWHLKRDISILLNGDIPLCREDIKGGNIMGNIFESSLDEIWNNGSSEYLKQLSGEYSGICRECDEYYTYNF